MPEGRTIVKKVENAVLYSDGTILVQNVRASYPHLTRPYKGQDGDGDGRYGIVGLLPKATHRAAKDMLRDQINNIMRENKLRDLPAMNKFLRDGNLRPDKPEQEGMYTLNAGEQKPPPLRGRGKDLKTGKAKILTPEEADRVFYPGCWVNILVKPWFQNNRYGKKVNANLCAVQFVRDDEPFGQGRISDAAVDDSFAPIDDDDDGYDDEDLADDEL